MKASIIFALILATLTAQAEQSAMGVAFSSKKEVVEEPGPEKQIVIRAQPELVRFLESGVMSAQAKAALQILSADKANEGLTLQEMSLKSLQENYKN